LHLGTKVKGWTVNHARLRTYLSDKYHVTEAYYFLGFVSGDGDYKRLVDYLVKKGKFGKMLFPNKEFASSLYKSLGGEYFDYLESPSIKAKIAHTHK